MLITCHGEGAWGGKSLAFLMKAFFLQWKWSVFVNQIHKHLDISLLFVEKMQEDPAVTCEVEGSLITHCFTLNTSATYPTISLRYIGINIFPGKSFWQGSVTLDGLVIVPRSMKPLFACYIACLQSGSPRIPGIFDLFLLVHLRKLQS